MLEAEARAEACLREAAVAGTWCALLEVHLSPHWLETLAALWEELRPVREDPALGVAGVHLYSFNDLAAGASLDLS